MRTYLSILIVVSVAIMVACGSGDEAAPATGADEVRVYDIQGTVVRLEPQDKVAVIDHGDIGDWMKAMTMGYPIKDDAAYAQLAEGDRIEGKVYVQGLDYYIADIHITAKAGEE